MRKRHPSCPDCRCMEEEFQEVGPTIWFCQQSEDDYDKMVERLGLKSYPVNLMYRGLDTGVSKFPRYPWDIDGRMVKHVKGDLIFLPNIGAGNKQYGWGWQFLKTLTYSLNDKGQALTDQEILAVIAMCGFIPKETVNA